MVQDDKHNILFFCVKMFKATGDSFYLEILCPDWDVYKNFWYLKEIIFESYFWKKRILMLTFDLDFQNCQNFVP